MGLGYTTFAIEGMDVPQIEDAFRVTLALRNTGSRRGKAVPQVYVGYADAVAERACPPAGRLTFSAGLSSRDIAATATVQPS